MKRCDPEQTNQRLKEKEGVEGQCDQVLQKLKALSNPKAVGGMACYGINPKNTYGVSIPNLRKMAKEIGVDHDLAQELWTSAVHEARILASMIDDPKTATEEQMERWAIDFDSWDTCDQCCMNLIEGHSSVEFGMS
jgi:3-methyladenine DNA glycosylase AlkD